LEALYFAPQTVLKYFVQFDIKRFLQKELDSIIQFETYGPGRECNNEAGRNTIIPFWWVSLGRSETSGISLWA